jgi:uncharacterized membrane protein YdfJ with MMPL/SSD domain
VAGPVLTDFVSLGVLASRVPREAVDDAVAATGEGGPAAGREAPPSAAVIMVAVFSILATLPIVDTKTLEIGLAAAVLIDATVVRGILLPAAMTLLGERCWYLPRWLSWLPGRKLGPAPAHRPARHPVPE